MTNSTIIRGLTILVGFAFVRTVEVVLPDYLPVAGPQWLIVGAEVLKYASGLWITHLAVSKFFREVSKDKQG